MILEAIYVNSLLGMNASSLVIGISRAYLNTIIRCYSVLNRFVNLYRDGSVQFWVKSRSDESIDFYCSIDKAHSCDVNAVDETSNAIISGSADGTVKVAFYIKRHCNK